MSHVTLIRHGQANSGANDEANYDKLSVLGHKQASWLGQHLRNTNQNHTRLDTGTLQRQIDTAKAMQTGITAIRDARLNELEYFTLASALEAEHGVPIPVGQANFSTHLPQVFKAWEEGIIEGAPETFQSFEARVRDILTEITIGKGAALVVTSGGLIAMMMRQHLGLSIGSMANVALAIMNTSIHRLHPIGGAWSPVMFNAIPHLEIPQRHYAQTYV